MKGTSQSTAKYMCKVLNYMFGEMLYDDEVKSFCSEFKEQNYCGFKG